MKAKVGATIIILSYLVSLNIYLALFCIPVFLIGALIFWFSSKKVTTKILWTIIPPSIWYPGFIAFMYAISFIGQQTAQKLDFIIPQGYSGRVIIISNQKNGQPVNTNNDREQLLVPSSGILPYQGEIESGYVNHNYYILDSLGNKIKIPELSVHDTINQTNILGAWLGGMGTKGIQSWNKKEMLDFNFMFLTISTKDSLSKYWERQYENKFDEQVDSVVRKLHTTQL